jgi:hypothetical protein
MTAHASSSAGSHNVGVADRRLPVAGAVHQIRLPGPATAAADVNVQPEATFCAAHQACLPRGITSASRHATRPVTGIATNNPYLPQGAQRQSTT